MEIVNLRVHIYKANENVIEDLQTQENIKLIVQDLNYFCC